MNICSTGVWPFGNKVMTSSDVVSVDCWIDVAASWGDTVCDIGTYRNWEPVDPNALGISCIIIVCGTASQLIIFGETILYTMIHITQHG